MAKIESLQTLAEPSAFPQSDANWDRLIWQFKVFRRFEDPIVLALFKKLPKHLEREATAIYRTADHVERTGKLPDGVELLRYSKSQFVDRLTRRGYADEIEVAVTGLEFVGTLPEQVEGSPTALRQRAHTIQNASDFTRSVCGFYLQGVEMLRAERRGRAPSLATFFLLRVTTLWKCPISEVARRLVAADVYPTSDRSDEPDPEHQWRTNLAKARQRVLEKKLH